MAAAAGGRGSGPAPGTAAASRRTPPGRAPPTRPTGRSRRRPRPRPAASPPRGPGRRAPGRRWAAGRWPPASRWTAATTAAAAGSSAEQLEQHRRARVAVGVEAVAEAGQRPARPAGARPRRGAGRASTHSPQHVVRQGAGRSVQRPLHRRQPGGDHGVGVRADGGGGAHGDGRDRQVVVDQHHQRGVQAPQQTAGRGRVA